MKGNKHLPLLIKLKNKKANKKWQIKDQLDDKKEQDNKKFKKNSNGLHLHYSNMIFNQKSDKTFSGQFHAVILEAHRASSFWIFNISYITESFHILIKFVVKM